MTQNYWQWPELAGQAPDVDWKSAKRITAGIDIGTASSQAAVMCDGRLFAYASIRTGAGFAAAPGKVLGRALEGSGMRPSDITGGIAATGWGKRNASFASKQLDEIHCHAKGARFMFGPDVHTVLDMGGQTVKAIRLYDWDRVRDFAVNDKCATGMGRGIEVICDLLQVPVTEIGSLSLDIDSEPEPVSTTCCAFANTETLGLFGRPEFRAEPLSVNQVYASHIFAVAWRILGVAGKLQSLDVGDIRVDGALAFTGGLAKNEGITRRIERELNTTALTSEYDPQLAGAIGAALLADTL